MKLDADAYLGGVVAANIRAEAARRRFSQSSMAAVLGLNQAAVSRRMTGKVEFSASELSKLAEAFDVPVSTFFGEVAA